MKKIKDVIILGAGPGGMTAAIYAKRAGLDVAVVERSIVGGALSTALDIKNFPGIVEISGMDLANKIYEHTKALGVEYIWDEIKSVKINGSTKIVECFGQTYKAKAIIIAFGASVKKLNLEGERDLVGKGISYCATCDGKLYEGKTVALVGSGKSAINDSLYLSSLVKKLYIINNRHEFTTDNTIVQKLQSNKNIEIMFNTSVSKLLSEDSKLKGVETLNLVTNKRKKINLDGLFVCVGRGPDVSIIDGELKLNEAGYIITDDCMRTSCEGIFAIGDIRNTPLRQVVTSCGDGAIAAVKAFEYIKSATKK